MCLLYAMAEPVQLQRWAYDWDVAGCVHSCHMHEDYGVSLGMLMTQNSLSRAFIGKTGAHMEGLVASCWSCPGTPAVHYH